MHHHSMQNVASDHGDLQRVFVIVVKRVAHGQTFDSAPRRRAYTLRPIVAGGTKNSAKIPGEEIAELVCRDRRYRFHWRSPNDRGSFRSPCNSEVSACPLLPTLPRHRLDRPFVLPRIPRSWTWPGNPRETLSECHGRQAPRLEHLQPRTFARPARSLRSVAHPDRGSSGPDCRSYEARAAHRS